MNVNLRVLSGIAKGAKPAAIHVTIAEDGEFVYTQAGEAPHRYTGWLGMDPK